MKTIVLTLNDPCWLEEALSLIQAGGLVAFPTDTVYGLGTSAFNSEAVEKIYVAKDRPIEKSIPVLLGTIADLDKVSINVPSSVFSLAEHFWPGPLTIILPRHPDIPDIISSLPTIGVRIPDHPVAEMLLRAAGPMAVTSANISGDQNPHTASDVFDQLNGRIDRIIDGGGTGSGPASTVVDCTKEKPEILRQGTITMAQILKVLDQ
jgi:L-threonylcarbamoyladenylate synthase